MDRTLPSFRERRGFTLAELTVALFLAGAVLMMMAQVMVPSLMMMRLSSAQVDVQQGALIFTSRATRLLMNAPVDSVTVGTSPAAVSFAETSEDDPFDSSLGVPRLQTRFHVLYYDAYARKVIEKMWPPGPPSLTGYDFSRPNESPNLSVDDLREVCARANGTERVIVKDVSAMEIAGDDGESTGLLVLPLRLTITCSIDSHARGAPDAREECRMTARVFPRTARW